MKTRTALVTGHRGFIGKLMTTALQDRGYDVTGMDLQDGLDIRRVLPDYTARHDLVVHCAAIVGGIQHITSEPLAVASDLAIDSVAVQFVARTRPSKTILFSSSAAYPHALQGRKGSKRLSEADLDPFNGTLDVDAYGLAKVCLERQALLLQGKGLNVTVVRPFSGWGETQDLTYPMPNLLQQGIKRLDPFPIFGSGKQVRDLVHADDLIPMILAVADSDIQTPVNICSGRGMSFDDVARAITAVTGYKPEFTHLTDKPEGVFKRVGDPGLIRTIRPAQLTAEESIERALANLQQTRKVGRRSAA